MKVVKKALMSSILKNFGPNTLQSGSLLMNKYRNKYRLLSKYFGFTKTDHFVNSALDRFEGSKQNILKNKLDDVVKWYEELTGMAEVRFMQNRVVEAQNKLVQAQEKRRESSKLLSIIQNKLKDIHSELDTTTKGEERYLHLVTQEHAVLKEEKLCNANFQLSEKEERECFSFLSAAVKESHEKERAQAERTKYWSVIGSIIGTVIGVIGSSINNEFKMKELRKLVKMSIEDHSKNLSNQHEEMLSLANELRTSTKEKNINSDVIDDLVLRNHNNYQQHHHIEKLISQQRQEIRITTVIAIVIPIVCLIIQKYS